MVKPSKALDRVLVLEMVRVTEAAAIAASLMVGRGDEKAADHAAVEAMRAAFNGLDFDGTVVIGEGERDEAPMLYIGEKVGSGIGTGPKIDIALDPFPFNGSTTTFEALWMGVPLVTLAGARFVSRVGASALTQIGLTDLIAEDIDGYIDRAVRLASDIPQLASLRRTLRDRLAASPLCDADTHARALESVLRQVWRTWCTNRPS